MGPENSNVIAEVRFNQKRGKMRGWGGGGWIWRFLLSFLPRYNNIKHVRPKFINRLPKVRKSLAQEVTTDQPESRPPCTKVLTSGVIMCCAPPGRWGGGMQVRETREISPNTVAEYMHVTSLSTYGKTAAFCPLLYSSGVRCTL